jgi:hypothetical protein
LEQTTAVSILAGAVIYSNAVSRQLLNAYEHGFGEHYGAARERS